MIKIRTLLATVPICAALAFAQTAGDETTSRNTQNLSNGTGQTLVGILVDASCSAANIPGSESSSINAGSANRASARTNDGLNSIDNPADYHHGAVNNGAITTTPPQQGAYNSSAERNKSAASAGDHGPGDGEHKSTDRNGSAQANNSESASGKADDSGITARGSLETSAAASSDTNNTAVGRDRARDVNHVTGTDSMLDRTQTSARTQTTPAPASTINNDEGSADRAMTGAGTGEAADLQAHQNWDKSCFISPSSQSFVLMLQDGRKLHLDQASDQLVVNRLQSNDRVQNMNKVFRVRVNATIDGDTLHISDIQI